MVAAARGQNGTGWGQDEVGVGGWPVISHGLGRRMEIPTRPTQLGLQWVEVQVYLSLRSGCVSPA